MSITSVPAEVEVKRMESNTERIKAELSGKGSTIVPWLTLMVKIVWAR